MNRRVNHAQHHVHPRECERRAKNNLPTTENVNSTITNIGKISWLASTLLLSNGYQSRINVCAYGGAVGSCMKYA